MLLTLLFITIVVSYIGTYSVEKFFLKYSLFIDVPSDRSSHKNPIPTAGGISILISYFLYIYILLVFHESFIPWHDGNPEFNENPFFIFCADFDKAFGEFMLFGLESVQCMIFG